MYPFKKQKVQQMHSNNILAKVFGPESLPRFAGKNSVTLWQREQAYFLLTMIMDFIFINIRYGI